MYPCENRESLEIEKGKAVPLGGMEGELFVLKEKNGLGWGEVISNVRKLQCVLNILK